MVALHPRQRRFIPVAENVTVTADDGEVFNLSKGDPVFMDHHFGHLAEPWIEGEPNVSLVESDHGIKLVEVVSIPTKRNCTH